MSDQGTTPETVDVAEAFRVDEAALSAWMSANVDGFSGPLTIRQFTLGQSNPTYKLETPNANYVLRRKPPGDVLKGAHAVDREARVMTALAKAGFPVPTVRGLCTDDDVLGSMFYIMDMVEGRIFQKPDLPELQTSERRQYIDAMNEVQATLHGIDYKAIGLETFGREGGYVARQINIWTKQYLADKDAGRNPHMDRLAEWLPANLPDSDETSIVHGDYRIDNMIFHPTEPRVIAVLDWELSTLGHPLADFTYSLMMYRTPESLRWGLHGLDLAAMNIPDEDAYVRAYCERTGRDGIADLEFFLAYNLFRFCAIIHGVKGRLLRGNAAAPDAAQVVQTLPLFAERGWESAKRCGAV